MTGPAYPPVWLVNNGPIEDRWNIVVMGDGFTSAEMGDYHRHVDDFVSELRSTPPFSVDNLWCAVNVIRLDVESAESGVNDPSAGIVKDTYFDAQFDALGPGGTTSHLIEIDRLLAQNTAETAISELIIASGLPAPSPPIVPDQVHVIVNSDEYGGGGYQTEPPVSVATHAPTVSGVSGHMIAVHEIGHGFKLADEYFTAGTTVPAAYDEPVDHNISLEGLRANNKWAALMDPGVDTPTSERDCAAGTVTPVPLPDLVGTHEGGGYYECGIYRPYTRCYMDDYDPFCRVCSWVIEQTLTPHKPPAPSLATLVTLTINFDEIPEPAPGDNAIKTFRAIKFEVSPCADLNFVITSDHASPFGTPFGKTGAAFDDPTSASPQKIARLWIQYEATVAGQEDFDTVEVLCEETGQTWDIPLHGSTTSSLDSAIVLVLDRSGSMAGDAGAGTAKVDKLREALSIVAPALRDNDGIGLVKFDHVDELLTSVVQVSAGGRTKLASYALGGTDTAALNPRGATAIGDAIERGQELLTAAKGADPANSPFGAHAMIVLTDGRHNYGTPLSTATMGITDTTYAIGLGKPSNIDEAILHELCNNTGAYLLITGDLDGTDRYALLTKYFLQCLAEITHTDVVVDPGGIIREGDEQRIPFDATEAERSLDVYLLTLDPSKIEFLLETPGGGLISPESVKHLRRSEHIPGDRSAIYRLNMPLLEGDDPSAHAGTWNVVLRRNHTGAVAANGNGGNSAPADPLRYDVVVHGSSGLEFSASTTQSSFEPDGTIHLVATLSEYSMPVRDRATIWAEVQRPNGTEFNVAMKPDGTGEYHVSFRSTVQGIYTVKIRARGYTLQGTTFTRERTLTAIATEGADRADDRPRNPEMDGERRHFGISRCFYGTCSNVKKWFRRLW